MRVVISAGEYKGQESVVLENEGVRAEILPGWGGKMASLVYKPAGAEVLWQNPGREYRKTRYGDEYVGGEFSGFDEMFPSLGRCYYEDGPWAGTEIPDHGEVWSIPWEAETEGQTLRLRASGVRFPYRLEKVVRLTERGVRMEYVAANLSAFDFHFLWAAHPLLVAEEGATILVPQGMTKIVNYCAERVLREFGQVYEYPGVKVEGGGAFDLSRMPARDGRGYHKYYFWGRLTEGWCGLRDERRGLEVRLAFPVERVPYLGVWLNEGGLAGQYNLALEPATGMMERLDLARLWGGHSTVQAHGRQEWYLEINVREVGESASARR